MRVTATEAVDELPVWSPARATIVFAPSLSGTIVLKAPPLPRATGLPLMLKDETPPLSVAVPVTVTLLRAVLSPFAGAAILTTGEASESASVAALALTPASVSPVSSFHVKLNGWVGVIVRE